MIDGKVEAGVYKSCFHFLPGLYRERRAQPSRITGEAKRNVFLVMYYREISTFHSQELSEIQYLHSHCLFKTSQVNKEGDEFKEVKRMKRQLYARLWNMH